MQRSETNMFYINFRELYLASRDISREAVFATPNFGSERKRQSDKNRRTIIRSTGPVQLALIYDV